MHDRALTFTTEVLHTHQGAEVTYNFEFYIASGECSKSGLQT